MEARRSQSFTLSEVSVALEIFKYAMRSNDLKIYVRRPEFVALYRKFSRMKEKMEADKAAAEKKEQQ